MELFERAVRFGDVGPGRLLHHTRVMHLLIVAGEALAERLDAPFDDVVAAGGVPHMPVAVRTAFEHYPRYGDRMTVHGSVLEVGDTSLTAGYALRRADGTRLATATVVHVTLDPEGTPRRVPDDVREQVDDDGGEPVDDVGEGVDDGGSDRWVEHDLSPDAVDVGADPFGHALTVRSSQLEAVSGAYFEEYFREIAGALEGHLAERGPSLAERGDGVVPFVPTGLAFEFLRPVAFEDRVHVEGRLDAGGESVVGHYRFRGTEATRLRGLVAYGCAEGNGELTGFPDGTLDGLR